MTVIGTTPVRADRRSIRICLPGNIPFALSHATATASGMTPPPNWISPSLRLTTRRTGSAPYARPFSWRCCGRPTSCASGSIIRNSTRLEARVSERTRIARELHDTLLQSLQALLFQYQAARNLFAAGSERAMQVLDASLDRTEQAIAESRDAIRDIRSDNVAQNALPELLTRAGSELANRKRVRMCLHSV